MRKPPTDPLSDRWVRADALHPGDVLANGATIAATRTVDVFWFAQAMDGEEWMFLDAAERVYLAPTMSTDDARVIVVQAA